MCRFALVKTTVPIKPLDILERFANMAKNSHAPDGDTQGDGWGISWREKDMWQSRTYLSPVWEMEDSFSHFPKTQLFLLHARSSSFDKDKGNVSYNQPYIKNNLAFVFNGLLKGVSFPRPLTGDIGAQKIWTLFREFSEKCDISTAFERTISNLNKYSIDIQALNVGISDGSRLYVYNQFATNPHYYSLHAHESEGLKIISSEHLQGFLFSPIETRKIYTFF